MAIILQMERFDEAQYPNVLRGIAERIHAPALQFVFVDTVEQVGELKQRIADDIVGKSRLPIFAIPVGPISASEAFTALVTGIPPTRQRPF
jgi:hypothetical protein